MWECCNNGSRQRDLDNNCCFSQFWRWALGNWCLVEASWLAESSLLAVSSHGRVVCSICSTAKRPAWPLSEEFRILQWEAQRLEDRRVNLLDSRILARRGSFWNLSNTVWLEINQEVKRHPTWASSANQDETGSCYVSQAGLELTTIFLPQPPMCHLATLTIT